MTEHSMRVSREVILDLLPLYLANEASPATRLLVEQYLSQDDDLAEHVRSQISAGDTRAPVELPPELELRSLSRTRALLRRQRRLFGMAIGLSVLSATSKISLRGSQIESFHFLIRDYPLVFGALSVAAIACWVAYAHTARRLKTRA
jgi:hypothetical protein